MPGRNSLTPYAWAKRIADRWHSAASDMIGKILATATDLRQAKAELAGEYLLMFEELAALRVPLSYSKANQFIAIDQFSKKSQFQHVGSFPPDWGTLYLLSRLAKKAPELFDELIANGTINSTMSRGEIAKVLRLLRVAEDEARVLNLVPIEGKFRTLVIDPAWEYDWLSIAGRAKPGYAMQSLDQLRALDLLQWVDPDEGCQLYCWVTNNFMSEACKLVAHWGFQHRTVITWIKPPPFGLGSYFRNSTEHVLFATYGETTTRPAAASIPTHFEAPRGEHSEKPEKFYDIVRAASYPPYGEGNQRDQRPDFTNLFTSREVAHAAAAAE